VNPEAKSTHRTASWSIDSLRQRYQPREKCTSRTFHSQLAGGSLRNRIHSHNKGCVNLPISDQRSTTPKADSQQVAMLRQTPSYLEPPYASHMKSDSSIKNFSMGSAIPATTLGIPPPAACRLLHGVHTRFVTAINGYGLYSLWNWNRYFVRSL
jgi:hypothetical protein